MGACLSSIVGKKSQNLFAFSTDGNCEMLHSSAMNDGRSMSTMNDGRSMSTMNDGRSMYTMNE